MILGPDACGLLLSSSARYEIGHSVRFNSADSAYFSRTPGGAGNRKTWTFSAWVKKAENGRQQVLLNQGNTANTDEGYLFMEFTSGDAFRIYGYNTVWRVTSRLFRDPTAWLHICVAVDTTQATAGNRIRIEVNGVEETSFSTTNNPSLNADTAICAANQHLVSRNSSTTSFHGYLADVVLIDGQRLSASSFGEVDTVSGAWRPIDARGLARGTTGFFLGFTDGASTTTLGYDAGAGTNDWTANNFSVTAGAGNDWLSDSPTNNYPVINPLDTNAYSPGALSNGNLDVAIASGKNGGYGSVHLPSGKWYWEVLVSGTAETYYPSIGMDFVGGSGGRVVRPTGEVYNGATWSAFGSAYTTGDTIGIAVDYDAGKIWFSKNGTWQGSGDPAAGTNPATTFTSGTWRPNVFVGTGGSTASVNFGQRAFAYTPPTGFKALCTANLPEPSIAKSSQYFNVKTYTGTGSSLALTGVGHQPDLVWIKSRSAATDHALYDSVRGVEKRLESNTADDEVTSDAGLTAFGTDGFTVNTLAQVNTNAATYAAWCWKKGATPGFDIVTYSGNGSTQNVNHSLGVAPDMIIVKARTTASTDQGWPVYHRYIAADAETDYLSLNSSSAASDSAVYWNDTAPTSSVFTLGNGASVNASGDTYVAYLFSAVPGFSSFGTFTGNASTDGPFVWLGFRPAFLMVKGNNTNGIAWMIWDKVRNSYNVMDAAVYGSASDIETTYALIDFLANGFKVRLSLTGTNTYVYAAFAECPFKYANAR